VFDAMRKIIREYCYKSKKKSIKREIGDENRTRSVVGQCVRFYEKNRDFINEKIREHE